MLGKSPDQKQTNLFQPVLEQIINPRHELVALSKELDWQYFEESFKDLYSHTGTPSKPIRLMVGLLMLKRIYNISDEIVCQAWVQNPYYQYFCGESEFQWSFPCDPSDLVLFRNRIGENGAELILKESIRIQGKDGHTDRVLIDTTVQEKNITFPTDSKLYNKVLKRIREIALIEGIDLRQSYVRIEKKLNRDIRFSSRGKTKKKAVKAQRRLKTITGRMIRDLERKLSAEQQGKYLDEIWNMMCIQQQQRGDKFRIYSLHEPEVTCIAKGKRHKKYEFGSKVSLAIHPRTNVILGVLSFVGNPYDGNTIQPTLDAIHRVTGKTPKEVIGDRGYRGQEYFGDTQVFIPGRKTDKYCRATLRKFFRRRSAIEPVIGHIKEDHRMGRNYLKGVQGDQINAILAASGYNLSRRLKQIKKHLLDLIFGFIDCPCGQFGSHFCLKLAS